eukprot:2162380-Rhodomonas_salina.3
MSRCPAQRGGHVQHLGSFRAKKGELWCLETYSISEPGNAAMRGSKCGPAAIRSMVLRLRVKREVARLNTSWYLHGRCQYRECATSALPLLPNMPELSRHDR